VHSLLLLLRSNRNYRLTWAGQVVSEIGDHFNTVAVMGLAMTYPRGGLVATGIFVSRAIGVMSAAPVAGVVLDRFNRKVVMISSDLVRAVLALLFLLCVHHVNVSLLFALSGLLMFASPFFTSGRSALMPDIATQDEIHAVSAVTQTTSAACLTIGAILGAAGNQIGFGRAFAFNAVSFLISAACISQLCSHTIFEPPLNSDQSDLSIATQYRDGLTYMRSVPLIGGISLVGVGWAAGGGAAQILFSLFGETIFHAGVLGIGLLWSSSGIGLLIGGALFYRIGKRLTFGGYKNCIALIYIVHGGAVILFSQAQSIQAACCWIALSRVAVSGSAILNRTRLLQHTDSRYRGRVFATCESMVWLGMLISVAAAGAAATRLNPRTIAVFAGCLSGSTGIFWYISSWAGKLPEPSTQTME
jgi:hypothetical protein